MKQFEKRCHRLSLPENTRVLWKVANRIAGIKQKLANLPAICGARSRPSLDAGGFFA